MKHTNLTVHQSDERMFFLERLLRKTKFSKPTHVFAPNINVDAETVNALEEGALIFHGKCTDEAREAAKSRGITLHCFMKDEKFQAVN